MTRTEYMRRLSVRLKHLPREDFDRAMEYFQEYFDEAGAEKEQQAIQDLGDPQSAAEQIIMDLAVEQAREYEKGIWCGLDWTSGSAGSSHWASAGGVCGGTDRVLRSCRLVLAA